MVMQETLLERKKKKNNCLFAFFPDAAEREMWEVREAVNLLEELGPCSSVRSEVQGQT